MLEEFGMGLACGIIIGQGLLLLGIRVLTSWAGGDKSG